MKTYKQLFNLTFLHTYFERDVCDCLSLQPDEQTQAIFNRFEIILRKTPFRYELYVPGQENLAHFLGYLEGQYQEACFHFSIEPTDSQFVSFTDFPIDQSGILTYNSQSIAAAHDINNAKTVQLLPSFTQTGGSIFPGKLSIYFSDLKNMITDQNPAPFEIAFQARSTQWQYFVINKGHPSLSGLQIQTNADFEFTGPISKQLPTGDKAQFFACEDRLLPLSQIPQYQFKLVADEVHTANQLGMQQQSQTILNALPTPALTNLNIIQEEGKTIVCSPMYIYI